MDNHSFLKFRAGHSVLSTHITVNPLMNQRENSFGLQFND